jgi:DNA-binding SARP family transcriptional activator
VYTGGEQEISVARLELHLLGPPQVTIGGTPLALDAHKPLALLFYLAVTGQAHRRDALATIFWPEQDQSSARAYLRRALWSLKKLGLEPWLDPERESVALKGGRWLDVVAFHDALASGRTGTAVDLYRGDFLTGFTLPDSPAFDEWQFHETERYRSAAAAALTGLVSVHEQQAEFTAAIEYARRLVALDPLQEESHRLLMRLYSYDGQRAAALRQYETCARLLMDELGVEPSAETRTLYESIRAGLLTRRRLPGPGTLLLDRYLLESELGQGGMAVVYRASDRLLERPVAVKVLSKSEPDPEDRLRLLAEAKAVARLNHPNIVAVHDAGEVNGVPFIVMELIEGSALNPRSRPPLDEALAHGRDICAALAHAHQQGIIHRDLKPGNILLGANGTVKLSDFGLARAAGASRITDAGTITGTIAYLAPELILGQPASEQSDLYALGVTLYEMVTGRLPFEGENAAVLLTNHLHAPVVPPGVQNPEIPAHVENVIVRLLEKEPARRPASAEEVGRLLLAVEPEGEATWPQVVPSPTAYLLDRIARGRLVGRQQELAQATELWLRALRGQGNFLLISGEPGIGKTRLAQAVLGQGRAAGAPVLAGGCYEFEATTPYLPLAEALRRWVDGQPADQLSRHLGAAAPELARLAPEIEQKIGPLVPNPSLPAQEERLRLFENVTRFLVGLAQSRGLLLFIDDLHWADQGTLSLLSYLLRRIQSQRLMVMATYREVELDRAHPMAAALVEWNRERLASRISLARFTVDETNRLIATLFGQERVSDDFATAIQDETEGNPFFIEEVIKALVEQGQIYRVGDHWERHELHELAIPQSIKEAIGRRLNRLSRSCTAVLHAASVIGKVFEYDVLAAVTSEGEATLLDALEEAVSAQLILQSGAESFAFTHDKIREVLYEEILSVRRRRLHRQIVEALERQDATALEGQVTDLAYHAIAGGDLARGLDYARRAGQRAEKVYALEDAVKYYSQAWECALALGRASDQIELDESMGNIYNINGVQDLALEHYQRAMDMAGTAQKRASLQVKVGLVYNVNNEPEGIPILESALEVLRPEENPLEVAQGLVALGRFHHYQLRFLQAIEMYRQALDLALPLNDPLTLAFLYSYLSGAYQHLLSFDESMEWARKCIALGETQNYPLAIASGYEFLSEDAIFMGRWADARRWAEEGIRWGRMMGSPWREVWGTWCVGAALLGMGDLQGASDRIQAAVYLGEDSQERRLLALAYADLALARLNLGDETAALQALERSRQAFERTRDEIGRLYHLGVEGQVLLALGRPQQALASFTEIDAANQDGQAVDHIMFAAPGHAAALLEDGDLDGAEARIEIGLALSDQAGSDYRRGVLYYVKSRLLAGRGEKDLALATLDEAVRLLRQTNSRLDEGRALLERARLRGLPGGLPDARAALELFDACGAVRDRQAAAEWQRAAAPG